MTSEQIVQRALEEAVAYADSKVSDKGINEKFFEWENIRISKLKELLTKIIDDNK